MIAILFSLLPFLTVLTLFLADSFLLAGGSPAPYLGLVALIYWSIYHPDLIKIYCVILLGIMVDVIHGNGAWIHAFIFLLINLIAISQIKFFYRKPFLLIWAGVSLIVLIYYMAIATYFILLEHAQLDLVSQISSYLLTVVSIPPVFKTMLYCHGLINERV